MEIELKPDKQARLEKMAADAGMTEHEVVMSALALAEWAIGQVAGGRSIAAVDERGERYKEVWTPILEAAVRRRVKACGLRARDWTGETTMIVVDLYDECGDTVGCSATDLESIVRMLLSVFPRLVEENFEIRDMPGYRLPALFPVGLEPAVVNECVRFINSDMASRLFHEKQA